MADITAEGAPRTVHRSSWFDSAFRLSTIVFATLILVLVAGIAITLFIGAAPSMTAFGLNFFVTDRWNPVTEVFGALGPIYGTLVTALIAMAFGVPISFGIAMFITQLCPPWLKRPMGVTIELLAGIPSIIYGIWGLFVLAPYLQSDVYPWMTATLGNVPVIGRLFGGPAFGVSIFTAGIILGIMVLPFISSIMRDVFETVPPMLRESAYGLGSTTSEVMWKVILPFTRVGVFGGIMLGLGRALGETMAVTFVIGNAHRVPTTLLAPGTSISAALANEFNEATGEMYLSSLISLGLILYLITLVVLSIAKVMLIRLQRQAGS